MEKQIKDRINELKSRLAEEKQPKLTKTVNVERVKYIESEIEKLKIILKRFE